MAFFNSGIRRIFQDSRRARNINYEKLDTKFTTRDTANDTDRDGIRATVAALNNDAIVTQKVTMLYNDFFYPSASGVHVHEFPTAVIGKISVVDFEAIIYNPSVAGMTPSYNLASAGHIIQLTRQSAAITDNATALTNSLYGGPWIKCANTAGPTAGPVWSAGEWESGDHRRSADHLNHKTNNTDIDAKIKIVAVPQSGIAELTSEDGENTKIQLIVRYRTSDFPVLS